MTDAELKRPCRPMTSYTTKLGTLTEKERKHLEPLITKERKNNILALFLREQKNHFVRLTFVACFYFFNSMFSLTVFYKERS